MSGNLTIAIVTAIFALVRAAAPAAAQSAQFVSIYTSTAPKDCRVLSKDSEKGWGVRACKGPSGIAVVVSEDDLRETVSAGRNVKIAENEPAAKSWFGPFNWAATTIEWRTTEKSRSPFAMILRWQIADNDDTDKDGRPKDKALLVVTRLPPGKVCHVAFVDVEANPDANELARKAAEETARTFKCGTDRVWIVGNSGRAVDLARPD
jgi:hypothetical protein